jgi:hypothetical protein
MVAANLIKTSTSIIMIAAIWVVSNDLCFSQNILQYTRWTANAGVGAFGVTNQAQSYDMTSDHGMRVVNGGTRFHRGVDFSPIGDANVVMVAHLEGRVVRILNP